MDRRFLFHGCQRLIQTCDYRLAPLYQDMWSEVFCFAPLGNPNNTFFITNEYGHYGGGDYFKLRANLAKLDRETISKYEVKITCKNIEYTDAKSATTTIHVKILDANDNLPVFEKEIYKVNVSKTLQPGVDIIQVRATDDDAGENGKITYSLVKTRVSYIFQIVKDLGVISLRRNEKLTKQE